MRTMKTMVFLASLLPLAVLVHGGLTDGLGANPVETITHATGTWGLRFLLLTLAITPLRRLTGLNALVRLRRMLGLFAFFYVSLHFTTYVWLDAYFDLAYIVEDIVKRLYITAGFTAFVTLVPLALTSSNRMIGRLGGRNWRRLHRLSYVAAIGAVLHFLWLVKADYREPTVYAIVAIVLLLARLPRIATGLSAARAKLFARFKSSSRLGRASS